jgi:metallophosphoesterase superfamily enzyme
VTELPAELTLRDGLVLLAPGGAYIPSEGALIVADTHAGLPMELRARGHAVPVGDDEALLGRVRAMLARTGARTLVVAGDLGHGPGSQRARAAGERSAIASFVTAFSGVTVRVVRGNHDRAVAAALDALGIEHGVELFVGPHAVTHGDDPARVSALRAERGPAGGRVLVGHVHPALSLEAEAGARAVCPAFVSARALLCLPALSVWARGGDVRSKPVRRALEALAGGDPMGVAVVVGERVLPVGDVFRA